MPQPRENGVRWSAIAAVTIAGLIVTGSPFALSWQLGGEFGTIESLASSALINIGTAVLLAALLFFIERGLSKRVRGVAERSAEAVVEARTQDLRNENSALSVRIDALQAQLEQQVGAADAERFADASRLATEVSFDNVAAALEQANDLDALSGGGVTVPAGADVTGPRVNIWWGLQMQDDQWSGHARGEARMRLQYVVERTNPGSIGTPVVEVDWDPLETPAQTLTALRDEMRRHGYGSEAKDIGTPLFQNLQAAITEAIAARTARDGSWAEGSMYEWVWDGWAVTELGLSTRDYGLFESAAFPESPHDVRMRGYRQGPKEFEATAPPGIDKAVWDVAVRRAKEYHPRGSYMFGGGGGAVYFTPSRSPRSDPDWPRA